ncbi:MAG: ExbD/TolR family protein [Rhodomicrobium sp.]
MAASSPGNGVHDPLQAKLMADINITPMVDVMLVLLVIFMVTAPLLVAGVPVELPKTSAQPIPQAKKPVIVTLAADRSLSIRDERVDASSLVPRLAALRTSQGDAVVYVRADKRVAYGYVMELLSLISASGYQRISLLSQPPSPEAGTPSPQAVVPSVPGEK